MNLQLTDKLIIVAGATSGLGNATCEALLQEGATVIGIARSQDRLQTIEQRFPQHFTALALDITSPEAADKILDAIGEKKLYGVLFNAAGPPAKTIAETELSDWDEAYHNVLRWKVDLTKRLLPKLEENGAGRFIYIESASVKQPLENMVLSNAFRVAVVGFVKTLSSEMAGKGITFNIMAPGSHETAAIERTIVKKSEQTGAGRDEVLKEMAKQTTVGHLGSPQDFASLACWLFSPWSRYINGQTISVDGGTVKGIMG